jgi:hypothetical protein
MMELKELEMLIEAFDYKMIEVDIDKLKVIPPSEGFDKSIRLGYIRSELQVGYYFNEFKDDDEIDKAKSMKDIIDVIHETIEDAIKFRYIEDFGYGRYVLEFPEDTIDALCDTVFKKNTLLQEDLIYLSVIFQEQLLTIEDIEKTMIRGAFSLQDFIHIRKFFYFILSLYQRQLYDRMNDIDQGALFRSIIPVFSEDVLYKLLSKITSRENIDTFLDLMCWDQGFENLFDIQYHPLLYIDGYFLFPLNIICKSNAIRNLYASEHKNNGLLINRGIEPLSKELYDSFRRVGVPCLQNVNFPNGDIDIVAILDDGLFIFECKHTLHPVNVYDIRTSFDYIKKAESQLDKIKQEYENGSLKQIIERQLDTSLSHINTVSYSIVLSHKLFSGNIRKFPIRHIKELTNVIEEGRLKTNDGEYCIWKGSDMTARDLYDFLGTDNAILNIFYNSLSVKPLQYPLTMPTIDTDWYYLDSEIILPKLKTYVSSLKKHNDTFKQVSTPH